MSVPRETDYERYLSIIQEWNSAINLVADARIDILRTRHLQDALQLVPLLNSDDKALVDFGSGGGFPAIPLAIARPDIKVTALEIDQRKIAFLTYVKTELKLVNFDPVRVRIEAWSGGLLDVITARACANLEKLIAYSAPFMHSSTRCYFFKGRQHATEIDDAKRHWNFDLTLHPSVVEVGSVIVELRNIRAK